MRSNFVEAKGSCPIAWSCFDAALSDVAGAARAVSRRGCRPGLTTQARLKNPDVAGIGGTGEPDA